MLWPGSAAPKLAIAQPIARDARAVVGFLSTQHACMAAFARVLEKAVPELEEE